MGLGPMEWVVIIGLILLFFGPSRLPGLGRSLGEGIRDFQKAMRGELPPEKQQQQQQQQLTQDESKKANEEHRS